MNNVGKSVSPSSPLSLSLSHSPNSALTTILVHYLARFSRVHPTCNATCDKLTDHLRSPIVAHFFYNNKTLPKSSLCCIRLQSNMHISTSVYITLIFLSVLFMKPKKIFCNRILTIFFSSTGTFLLKN